MSTELVISSAVRILREHAEGRSVDPERLDWAIDIALANVTDEQIKAVARAARRVNSAAAAPAAQLLTTRTPA